MGEARKFHDDLKREGYSKEEEYFYRVNHELIEKRRKELDLKRRLQRVARASVSHWMKCPKCGHEMEDATLSGIQFERCTGCHGVFFDEGEIETLLKTREQKSFLSAFWGRFVKRVSKLDSDWKP